MDKTRRLLNNNSNNMAFRVLLKKMCKYTYQKVQIITRTMSLILRTYRET